MVFRKPVFNTILTYFPQVGHKIIYLCNATLKYSVDFTIESMERHQFNKTHDISHYKQKPTQKANYRRLNLVYHQ